MAVIQGTSKGETLIGTSGDDTIYGRDGNDTLKGAAGNDTLEGGAGRDMLYGGSGNDWFSYSNLSDIVAGETLSGGDGSDTLLISSYAFGRDPVDLSGLVITSVERLLVGYGNTVQLKLGQLGQFTHIEGNVALTSGGSTVFAGEIIGGYFQLSDAATKFDASANRNAAGITVFGGAGADTIIGGALGDYLAGGGGADVIAGGDGDDTITGGAGKDDLRGGAGNDTFVVTRLADAAEGDVVHGGAGFDVLQVKLDPYEYTSTGIDLTQITLDSVEEIDKAEGYGNVLVTAAQVAGAQRLSGVFEVFGTGALSLAGKTLPASAFILHDGMTDIDGSKAVLDFYGLGLYGNDGANVLTGTIREDNLEGRGGNDTLRGLAGNDRLIGGDGNDRLDGGSGNDMLDGGNGVDTMLGGAGDDVLVLSGQDGAVGEVYDGGTGRDELQVGPDARAIDLSQQTLRGIEVINAGPYGTVRMAVAQFGVAQQLQGHFALADGGAVTLAGKTVYDFNLDLSDAGNSVDASSLSGYFAVYGGLGNDSVLGGSGVDYVFAGGGDDTARGNAGADQLYGQAGNDTLDGGADNDMLNGGAGKDVLRGGAGDDVLVIGLASDIVTGETYDGGEGSDTLLIQSTVDIDIRAMALTAIERLDSSYLVHITASNAQLGGFASLGAANYVLKEAGTITFASTIAAGAMFTMSDLGNTLDFRGATTGPLTIEGGKGNDTAWTGTGNDTLTGGGGADVLTGGAGADTFVFATGDLAASRTATDRITDFSHAEGDRIDLYQIDANAALLGNQAFTMVSGAFTAAGQMHVVQDGGNTYVELNTNADTVADLVLRLDGAVTLVAGDFVL